MSEVKQVGIAMSQLRAAAQKAAQEEIKKVTAEIVALKRTKRAAEAKAAAEIEKADEAIAIANEKAATIVSDFEADWGTWDTNSKPEVVSN